MDTADRSQPVLRCGRCNKPFDKQSSLTRHGYYCRSRRVANTSRSRSCLACVKGKTACDNQRPACSRCMAKRITCLYPGPTAKSSGQLVTSPKDPTAHDTSSTALTLLSDSVVGSGLQGPGDTDHAMFHDVPHIPATAIPDASFAGLEVDNGGNSGEAIDFDFAYLMAQTDFHSSVPPTPSSAVRSLVRRSNLPAGAQRTSNLIFHTLKSYPLIMMRHGALPPFIHPSLVAPAAQDFHMEPVNNCISLVHMLGSGMQSSRKLFWKNVRLECERLVEEVYRLSKWELLAALQAISIYILIRLQEGETEFNNLDSLLMRAVAVTAQQISHDSPCNQQCGLCNERLDTSWKDWTYRESRRRLAVVYRAVNMLVYFEPAAQCPMPRDLVFGPLPSRKKLWEAGDEFSWRAEAHKEPGGLQTAFGLAEDGDIVKLDQGRLSCSDGWLPYKPNNTTRAPLHEPDTNISSYWDEWCSGMDELGGLVMLAASLIV